MPEPELNERRLELPSGLAPSPAIPKLIGQRRLLGNIRWRCRFTGDARRCSISLSSLLSLPLSASAHAPFPIVEACEIFCAVNRRSLRRRRGPAVYNRPTEVVAATPITTIVHLPGRLATSCHRDADDEENDQGTLSTGSPPFGRCMPTKRPLQGWRQSALESGSPCFVLPFAYRSQPGRIAPVPLLQDVRSR